MKSYANNVILSLDGAFQTCEKTIGWKGSASDSTYCPECGQSDEERLWVQCDNPACEAWYHVECTDIDPEEYGDLCAITWFCKDLLSSLLIL